MRTLRDAAQLLSDEVLHRDSVANEMAFSNGDQEFDGRMTPPSLLR